MLELLFSLLVSPSNAPVNNYATVVQTLQQIQAANPTTTQLIDLGLNDSGQNIVGIKIGDGPTADLIVGTHHGNEYGSTAVAMGAADAFAKNPIKGHTVYIVPVLNIPGFNSRSRYERLGGMSSVDQNRDYPGPCISGLPFKSKSTKALANFIDQKNIISSATLHTHWPAVLYPWGFSTRDVMTKDDATFIQLGKDAVVESGYDVGNSKDMLYAADGAFEDYAYWKHGIWSLLFEMGETHTPSEAQMAQMVSVNVPGIRRFFENAPKERAKDHAFTGKCDRSIMQRTHLE